jgi:hypothetical protein
MALHRCSRSAYGVKVAGCIGPDRSPNSPCLRTASFGALQDIRLPVNEPLPKSVAAIRYLPAR